MSANGTLRRNIKLRDERQAWAEAVWKHI